jgi:hypothetical protein
MSSTTTPSTAQSVSGILLPADSEQPARRVDVHDPQEYTPSLAVSSKRSSASRTVTFAPSSTRTASLAAVP